MTYSSAAFQKVLSRTSSKTFRDVGSSVLMQKEAISKRSLAQECKYTVLIFVL
jgi:hypothetical protein